MSGGLNEFYVTIGTGQPYFPGYFAIHTSDVCTARLLARQFLNNRYCTVYKCFESLHELDSIKRGDIYKDRMELIENER